MQTDLNINFFMIFSLFLLPAYLQHRPSTLDIQGELLESAFSLLFSAASIALAAAMRPIECMSLAASGQRIHYFPMASKFSRQCYDSDSSLIKSISTFKYSNQPKLQRYPYYL